MNSRVLLGKGWGPRSRRVRSYVLHPEYEETYNTIALIQLSTPVRSETLKPLCPPPERLRNPEFYVVKFKDGDDFNNLQKQVIPVTHVGSTLCRDFYVRANLGLGVRGPGCGAPSRYLDMMSYYPWIENSLEQFRRISISKISKQKYVLRGLSQAYQRFGNCDEEEKVNLIFREFIKLRTDNAQYQFLTYNLSLYDNVEFSCLTLELVNASAVSEMRIKHMCPRESRGPPCHRFKGSVFDISLYIMFSDTARFEMFAWGFKKNMTLINMRDWRLEEGTYYEDFFPKPEEYRGPTHETEYGFEPLELFMWVPEYDYWSTTPTLDPDSLSTAVFQKGENIGADELVFDTTNISEPKAMDVIGMMTGIPNPMPRYYKPTHRPNTEKTIFI